MASTSRKRTHLTLEKKVKVIRKKRITLDLLCEPLLKCSSGIALLSKYLPWGTVADREGKRNCQALGHDDFEGSNGWLAMSLGKLLLHGKKDYQNITRVQ